MTLDRDHIAYLESQHLGRLATVTADGTPHNKPVGYHYNAELQTLDIAGINLEASAKYRNIVANPHVSFVVDDAVGVGAEGMRFVEIRGEAEPADAPGPDEGGISRRIIRIWPHRVISWNIGAGESRFQALDLKRAAPATANRPVLAANETATGDATAAVDRLVHELQQGLDTGDADIYNQHFADDVLWGSPYGATITGFDELHDIHAGLLRKQVAGRSRYEVVRVACPRPGVALAHVRRTAIDDNGSSVELSASGRGRFSEMALYVLIRQSGHWWLAAGQNTPLR
jgi:PPOX class F420-dependent enzyme/OxyR family protein/uncharacterized protein (TIGR02246 family)